MSTDAATLSNIVVANHILANEEVVDAFGHISFRHPDDPEKLSQISAIEERDGVRNMLDTFVWGEEAWNFISKQRPQWMIDAKSVASNAKAEQELEAHNRGLREKSSAAIAEARIVFFMLRLPF